MYKDKKIFLPLLIFIFSPVYAVQPSIQGCWMLVDVSAIDVSNSTPFGVVTRKEYYSANGKLYILGSNEKLTNTVEFLKYSFDGMNRKVIVDPTKTVETKVDFKNKDLFSLKFSEKEKWTYRRIGEREACDEDVEPISVQVIAMKNPDAQQTTLDIDYDENDYSELSFEERIQGIWEVNQRYGVKRTDLPPYGYSNELYIFVNNKFYTLYAGEITLEGKKPLNYSLKSGNIYFYLHDAADKNNKMTFSYNDWGHLVLKSNESGVSLKLLSKNTKNIPLIPTKIISTIMLER